jgi:ABC-2 type transport system ATP-binding protein
MRQRLGVARCLLADPALLVLDEPANGLDPAGIHEFREMIRGFVNDGRTVFLSSHLLDEVERICDYVAIVDNGTVITQGTIDELRAGGERLIVGCDQVDRARELVAAHPAVTSADIVDDGLSLVIADPHAAATINRLLVEAGIDVFRLESRGATLEERFLEVTSRLGASA